MVRKRRTELPSEGESSQSQQEASGGGSGRGYQQRAAESAPPQQQQGGGGGGYQGGRGWGPQGGRGGYGGGGYGGGRGGGGGRGMPPQQQYGAGPPEYQGRGRGGPPQQGGRGGYGVGGRGGMSGGRGGGPSSGGPSRPQDPALRQATQVPHYPGVVQSQPTPSEASSSTQPPDVSQVVQQVEQLDIQEGASSQQIQPVPPSMTSRGVNRAVMKQLVTLYKESHLGNRLPAYDGRKSLYTAGPLPFQNREFRIILTDEDDGAGGPRRDREFKVVIKLAARADLHHLGLFLEGRQADAPQEALQVLDIVLRELPTTRYSPVGRSFYSPDLGRRQSLGEGLESWRGFYQSIRPTQMGLSLNIDMSSTAFIEPLPVIEFVTQLLNRDVTSRPLSDSDRIKIKKALRGVKVEVTHRGNMRRKYRISGLTSQATRELTFPVDERGTLKSVVEYFYETYGFVIQHTQWPCLQVGNQQRPNYLPMEVCKIVEGQRYSKRLNEKQITALLKVTCQRPQERERDIMQTVRHNAYHDDPYAREFGIRISERLASVEARILPAPWLKYHDTGREKDCLPQVGQWNMMNKKMVNGGTVNNWICINFSRNVQDSVARGFCQELAQMCYTSGMVVASQDWPEVTKYAGLVCAQAHRQELIQDLFKTWQDPVRGTVSGGMIKELLMSFRRATGQKPQRIIFYRDGVSEGQFYQVLLYELDAIRKACASLEPNYQPPVTFVVVQKRHHTRLFADNHRDHSAVDRSGNILPGTVVDSKICHPTEFDFYLCSHAGIQGTSRPAHYHVLWDENKFTADGLQSLTNNLCYTYARCTRSVSIVPPAYYAHLAAFRARFYMEPDPSDTGSMTSGAPPGRGGMGGAGRGTRAPGPSSAVRPLPALKENVKRVMFYC
ncbi:hypothetical protein FH972_020689 [Carpinus fangiana]|uniref:Piwi domain-containing protein n=1 Tax=Carpinus fangiana TaxID=176857 RepID=A0A5N6RU15_9ROSI|nr:hypothetical protein FH972_020689 [Carpinus fangiana]